jgi:C1A family cysteine protease
MNTRCRLYLIVTAVAALGLLSISTPRGATAQGEGLAVAPVPQFNAGSDAPEALADLQPYQPSGWNDRIPISTTQHAGTDPHTETGPYNSGQVLYFNWASANYGGTAAVGYTVRVEVTGTGGGVFTWSSITTNPGYYVYLVSDQPVGPLSAGSHTFKVWVDYTGVVPESNETNNYYERTITVGGGGQPDLQPYQPATWNDKIPISTSQLAGGDPHTQTGPYYYNQTLYFNFASLNSGTATASNYTIRVEVTGTGGNIFTWSGVSTDPGYYVFLSNDQPVGPLSAGTHTFKIWVDYTGAVSESNETNNYYERTITVTGGDPIIRIAPEVLDFYATGTTLAAEATAQAPLDWSQAASVANGGRLVRVKPAANADLAALRKGLEAVGAQVIALAPEGDLIVALALERVAAVGPMAGAADVRPYVTGDPLAAQNAAPARPGLGARLQTLEERERTLDALGATRVAAVEPNELAILRAWLDNQETIAASVDNSLSNYFPPIRSQGGQGSCTAWAAAYYYNTYTQANDENLTVSGGDNNHICSPAFLYPLENDGVDNGAYTNQVVARLNNIGCCSWTNMPYSQLDWTTWPSEASWVEALKRRTQDFLTIYLTADAGIAALKQHLANGNVAVTQTYVYSNWYPSFQDNAGRGIQNGVLYSHAGESYQGSHAMTFVGYDDNRSYIDGGVTKYGAFLIANSWGNTWGTFNSSGAGSRGFMWVSYEYAKAANDCFDVAYFNSDRDNYRSRLYAVAGLNHTQRGRVRFNGGVGPTGTPAWNSQYAIYEDGGTALALTDSKRVAVDLNDGIPFIADMSNVQLFVRYYVTAAANGTITSAQFYHDFDGDGSPVAVSSTDPTVTVAPGTAGFARVTFSANMLARAFTIFNDGTGDLVVSDIRGRDGDTWLSWSPDPVPGASLTIPPGNSYPVTVVMNPASAADGLNTEQLIVESNDADKSPYPTGVYINLHKGRAFRLTAPDGGESWLIGGTRTIQWEILESSTYSLAVRIYRGPVGDFAGSTLVHSYTGIRYDATSMAWFIDPALFTAGTTYWACVSREGCEPASYWRDGSNAQFTLYANRAPVAVNDVYGTSAGVTLDVPAPGVLGNDSDPDGDPLRAFLGAGPSSGTLTVNMDGSVRFVPNAGFVGTDSFTYRAYDGNLYSNYATVYIRVIGSQNRPPVANNDLYTVMKDTALALALPGVLANDTDPEGEALSAVWGSGPANGSLVFNASGSFTYTPNPGWTGTDSFTYRARDTALNLSNLATVSVRVTEQGNHRPVGNPEGYATPVNTPLAVAAPGVLANDSDPDGDTLMARLSTGLAHGVLILYANGGFRYTPNADFVGADTFTYRAYDGWHSSAVTVTIRVGAQNTPPVTNGDQYTLLKNTSLVLAAPGILVNDTDANGDPLTAVLGTGPVTGTLTLLASGQFTYTPNAGFVGTDSFTYRAHDGTVAGNLATVRLRVTEQGNHRPAASPDNYWTPANTELLILPPGVLGNDGDADGDSLMARLSTGPANGVLYFNFNGGFRYVPNAGFVGPDSFTYRAYDGSHSPAVTVTIGVGRQNSPPVALDDFFTLPVSTAWTVVAPGVLVNDSDADGDPLRAALAGGPTNGTLVFNSTGAFTYTPTPGFVGTDSFTYRASDTMSLSNLATVHLRVSQSGNRPPVGAPDSYDTPVNTPLDVPSSGVLRNDYDPDGDTIMARLRTLPTSGTLIFNFNGAFRYVPFAGFQGFDSFTYRPYDGSHGPIVTVTIRVGRQNDPPVANPDQYTVLVSTAFTLASPGCLANDADPNGDPLSTILVAPPTSGVLALNANGSFTYTPDPGYVGVDLFTYRAFDGLAASNIATVYLRVTQTGNHRPVANPDNYGTPKNTPLIIPAPGVLVNDTDPDGDTIMARVSTLPANGTLLLGYNGALRYTPTPGFVGNDSFTYRAYDGTHSPPATVTIVVSP